MRVGLKVYPNCDNSCGAGKPRSEFYYVGKKMTRLFQIDGIHYNTDDFNKEAKVIIAHLSFVHERLNELKNNMALLSKAKNGYIEDLKTEIIQERTGVDFSDLFNDE